MIRIVRETDADEVLRIYAPAVQNSVASLETHVPSLDDMRGRIRTNSEWFPWLVDEAQGTLRGFAYASSYRIRQAYQWSVEVSIYVDQPYRRQGRGRALYERLFEILAQQGFAAALAAVVVPNAPSEHLHESMGFERVGMIPGVGFKHDAWRDLSWWMLRLQATRPEHPLPPLSFHQWRQQMGDGLKD